MTVPPDDQLMRDAEELHEALNQLVRVYQFRDRDRICCYDVSVTPELRSGDARQEGANAHAGPC